MWLREFPFFVRLKRGCGYASFSTFTAPALDGLRPSALAAYCSPPFTGFGYFLAAALTRGTFTCGCALGGYRLASACKHTLGDVPRSRHDIGVPRQGEATRLPHAVTPRRRRGCAPPLSGSKARQGDRRWRARSAASRARSPATAGLPG